jgi:hypothetical protein
MYLYVYIEVPDRTNNFVSDRQLWKEGAALLFLFLFSRWLPAVAGFVVNFNSCHCGEKSSVTDGILYLFVFSDSILSRDFETQVFHHRIANYLS